MRFAYLFGSQARGPVRPDSDVDVAVHLGGETSTLDLRLDLIRRLHHWTGVETQVVVLDNAPLRLVERVLREGQLIFFADEPARVAFEATMRKVCGDFAIHADRLDRALISAVAEGRR